MKAGYLIPTAFLFFLLSASSPALAEAPKISDALQRVLYEAQKRYEQNDFASAAKIIEEHLKRKPDSDHYLLEFVLANSLAGQNRTEDAVFHYQKSLNLYNGYSPAWNNLAKLYYELKEYGEAGEGFLKSHEYSDKKEPQMLYQAAACFLLAGENEKAIVYLEEIVIRRDDKPEAAKPDTVWIDALLRAYLDSGRGADALNAATGLIEKDIGDALHWRRLAQTAIETGNYEKALSSMNVAIRLSPAAASDYMLIGDLYGSMGIPSKAALYYEKAVSPDAPAGDMEKLVTAYMSAYEDEKAYNALKDMVVRYKSPKLLLILGDLLYEKGDYEGALESFEQSASLDSGDGRAYLMMGYSALQTGEKDKAEKAFLKASGYDGQRKAAEELLKTIETD